MLDIALPRCTSRTCDGAPAATSFASGRSVWPDYRWALSASRGWRNEERRRPVRSSSSSSAAAFRTTTASTSSPMLPTTSAASTLQSPRPSRASRSAKSCRSWREVMDRVTLVRSGSHNNDHHETATNWVLSGRFGTPFGDYPAIGRGRRARDRLLRHAPALRRGAAQPVVHLGARQVGLPRRPVRVVQGRRPEPDRTTGCRTCIQPVA